MAKFKAPSKSPPKVNAPQVPMPKANPLGTHRQPAGFVRNPEPPRVKPKRKVRNYAKYDDPGEFGNSGFGSF